MRNGILPVLLACLLPGSLCVTHAQSGLTFRPEFTFSGSQLDGWKSAGSVQWEAQQGEILAKPRAGQGGLLQSDSKLQDVAVRFAFRAPSEAEVGVLLRFQQTSNAFRGVLVSVKNSEV